MARPAHHGYHINHDISGMLSGASVFPPDGPARDVRAALIREGALTGRRNPTEHQRSYRGR